MHWCRSAVECAFPMGITAYSIYNSWITRNMQDWLIGHDSGGCGGDMNPKLIYSHILIYFICLCTVRGHINIGGKRYHGNFFPLWNTILLYHLGEMLCFGCLHILYNLYVQYSTIWASIFVVIRSYHVGICVSYAYDDWAYHTLVVSDVINYDIRVRLYIICFAKYVRYMVTAPILRLIVKHSTLGHIFHGGN